MGEEIVNPVLESTLEQSFTYLGIAVSPLGQLNPDESDINTYTPYLSPLHISPQAGQAWDYDQFYEAANNAGCGEFDLFLMNGKIVLPSSNGLWEFDPPAELKKSQAWQFPKNDPLKE